MAEIRPTLGVIMLDTTFERPPGDVGHPDSWSFPVKFRRVGGASVGRVIRQGGTGLIEAFVEAGQSLIDEGCGCIITSCGFMARHQRTLAKALGVPVAASSLLQLPMIEMTLGEGRRAGVITYDAASISTEMFTACAADPSVPVRGVPPGGAFHALIEGGAPYDRAALEAEVLQVARALVTDHPETGAILLECTNMPPFSRAIARAAGRPVFDILTLGEWLVAATAPRSFNHEPKGSRR